MLEVSVNINREKILAQLHAVRTKPRGNSVKEGTICTYNIVYANEVVGVMKGAYGCSIDLAIKLLEKFKEDGHMYKTIAMVRMIGEEDDKRRRKK